MTPIINILSNYLSRPGTSGDARSIAKAPVLLSFANTVVALILTIKTIALTDEQRQKLAGKGGTGQRQRSRAFQEFLAKRPEFAAQTQVDPTILQQVIDKDESFDALAYVGATLTKYLGGAQLQLGAFLTEEGNKVLAFLQKAPANVPLKDLAPLAVTFVPVEVEASKQDLTEINRSQRQARAAQAAQSTVQTTRQQIGVQQQIGQLTQAAASGTIALPVNNQPKHKGA